MKDNIALIGFMGSGKSTIGRQLANSLEMNFVDTDKLIASNEKMSVNDIFLKKGERYFRDTERSIIFSEAIKNNTVISTGGGAILDNVNIKNLKKTCFVVYLNCTLECLYARLKDSTTRPILNNAKDKKETIKNLLESRKFLYEFSADFIVDIDVETKIFETVERIKEAYINSN